MFWGLNQFGVGNFIALGLPRGFNKPGFGDNGPKSKMNIRLFRGKYLHPGFDDFNVPVWAMEEGGFLFVRTYAPRINYAWVDVIKDGKMSDVPGAINVCDFYDSID